MRGSAIRLVALVLAIGSFGLLYGPVLARLWQDWANDDNYSHGFLIIPLAAYFAWERRTRLAAAEWRPSNAGALVLLAGLAVLLVGQLGAELFLARVSMLMVLAGIILFVCGAPIVRTLAFPLGFLMLMIPIPALVFNQIAFPLQLVASQAGAATLSALSIPVLREGNVIVLAHTSLEVAEACSGIRSLISLLTLGVVYGYFTDPRPGVRAAIALSTVPIAIVANAGRVAGTGIAAHYYGAAAAEGFFHTFSGWIVFMVALALLFLLTRALLRLIAPPPGVPALAR
jgi:exosortase